METPLKSVSKEEQFAALSMERLHMLQQQVIDDLFSQEVMSEVG